MTDSIPWRDWCPDWKVPAICEADGCESPVRRAVYFEGNISGGGDPVRCRFWIFACAEHAGDLVAMGLAAP